jgi:hypothetical protein
VRIRGISPNVRIPYPPEAAMGLKEWSEAMMNVMEINGVKAVIAFDPEINMFRGEFVGLNGGADFYSTDIDGLRREGETSLKVFLDMCAEEGVSPYREFRGQGRSGKSEK